MYFTAELFILITACSTNLSQDETIDALFPELKRLQTLSQLLVDPVEIQQTESGVPEETKAFNLRSEEYEGSLTLDGFRRFSKWFGQAASAAAADVNQNILAHFRLIPEEA